MRRTVKRIISMREKFYTKNEKWKYKDTRIVCSGSGWARVRWAWRRVETLRCEGTSGGRTCRKWACWAAFSPSLTDVLPVMKDPVGVMTYRMGRLLLPCVIGEYWLLSCTQKDDLGQTCNVYFQRPWDCVFNSSQQVLSHSCNFH